MSNSNGALPHAYQSMIVDLYEAGGSGEIDIHGRVHVASTRAGPQRVVNGDAVAWLRIMGLGLLEGEAMKAILNDAGRAAAEAIIAGRTRTGPAF